MDSKNIKLQKQIEDIVTTILPITKSDNVQYKDSTISEEIQIKGIELMDYTEYTDLVEKKQNVPYFIKKSTVPHFNLNLQYNDENIVTYALDDYEGISDVYANTQNHIVNLYDENSYGVNNGVLWFIDEEGTMRMFGTLTARMNDVDSDYIVYENYMDNITSVYANFNPTDAGLAGQFAYLPYVTTIEFGPRFNTRLTTDMCAMFYACESLTTLNVNNFDTSNVTDMNAMFCDCINLTDLDLSNFNTKNVIDMGSMFGYCSSLTDLDVSSLDTTNVINMGYMFEACSSLTSLDVSGCDTSNVISMKSMFYGCSSLTNLDVSKFDTSNVISMGAMFYRCSSLTSIDVSSFDISNVIYMGAMFYDCKNLTDLDLSNFDAKNVADMSTMFCDCTGLVELTLPLNIPNGPMFECAQFPSDLYDDDHVLHRANTPIDASMSGKHLVKAV